MARNRQRKKPENFAVQSAVAAVEDSDRPLELDVTDLDTAPTSLGLDDREEAGERSDPRRPRPAVDECVICGQPL